MTVIHEIAAAVRHQESVCPGCNGNRYYLSGDTTVWCAQCQPARAVGQEKIRDCGRKHRNSAMQHYAASRSVPFVVTLAGKRNKRPDTHDYHVLAGSLAGAIHTAIRDNFILEGTPRFVKARLACPCDSWGVQ